jgi:alkylated DNA repair dioxygenase AlkB
MREIVDIGNQLLNKYKLNKTVKSIFFNLYENGQKKTPYHKDSYNKDVFTLSLGSTRKFRIKNDLTGKSTGFDLKDGDSFYFTQKFNKEYKHAIMPTKKNVGQRISIVFFIS